MRAAVSLLLFFALVGCESARPIGPDIGDTRAAKADAAQTPLDAGSTSADDASATAHDDATATRADDASTAGGDDATATMAGDATATMAGDAGATSPDATSPDATSRDAASGRDAAAPDGADLCSGVACGQAPPPTCVGNTTLRTFTAPGTCAAGQCSFSQADTTCADRCSQGACVVLTCGAARCDTPPGPTCVDANTIRRSAPIGACNGATMTCAYSPTDSICTQGCAGGACAPGSWYATVLDDNADVTAIAVDPLDQPHIAFFHQNDLRVASRSDRGWTVYPVDANMGQSVPKIVADASGGVHVLYDDVVNHNVRYAYRTYGAASFTVEFVASIGDVTPIALAIDAAGVPVVAYADRTNVRIRAVRRTGPSQWTETHSMAGGSTNNLGNLVLGPSGEPFLAYSAFRYRGNTVILESYLLFPSGASWTSEVLPTKFVRGAVRTASGELHVLLGDLATGLSAHHRSVMGIWTSETIDPTASPSATAAGALLLDAQGGLHVGYYRYIYTTTDHGLAHARYTQGSWTFDRVFEVVGENFDGPYTNAAIGPSGNVHFAAISSVRGDLYHVAP
jgi:hypothetical protein